MVTTMTLVWSVTNITLSWGCNYVMQTSRRIRSAMWTPIRQKRPDFRIPYFRPSKCRPCTVPPGAHAPPCPPLPPPLGQWPYLWSGWILNLVCRLNVKSTTITTTSTGVLNDYALYKSTHLLTHSPLYMLKFCSIGMHSGSSDYLKFLEVSANISETVQDRHTVTMED